LRIFAVCTLPSPPILLHLALHRWRIRIFDFDRFFIWNLISPDYELAELPHPAF